MTVRILVCEKEVDARFVSVEVGYQRAENNIVLFCYPTKWASDRGVGLILFLNKSGIVGITNHFLNGLFPAISKQAFYMKRRSRANHRMSVLPLDLGIQ
jgi:hypothetical protein